MPPPLPTFSFFLYWERGRQSSCALLFIFWRSDGRATDGDKPGLFYIYEGGKRKHSNSSNRGFKISQNNPSSFSRLLFHLLPVVPPSFLLASFVMLYYICWLVCVDTVCLCVCVYIYEDREERGERIKAVVVGRVWASHHETEWLESSPPALEGC